MAWKIISLCSLVISVAGQGAGELINLHSVHTVSIPGYPNSKFILNILPVLAQVRGKNKLLKSPISKICLCRNVEVELVLE